MFLFFFRAIIIEDLTLTDSTEKFTDTDVKVQIARDQAPQLAKKAKKESVSEAAGRAAVWGGDRMAASLAEFLCRSTPLFANFLPIFFSCDQVIYYL